MAPVHSRFETPSLYCPIPSAIHQAADRIEERSTQWLDALGLPHDDHDRSWLLATRSAGFSCRVIPDGDEDAVLLFALWNYFGFLLDDRHDGDTPTVSTAAVVDFNCRVVRALEEPGNRVQLGERRLDTAVTDLVARTRAVCSSVQLHRFGEALRDWLAGGAWMAAQIERRTMPTVEEYAATRVSDNGTRFSMSWHEIARRIDVPAAQWTSPAVQALVRMSGFLVSVTNDLLGYAKDDHRAVTEVNIVNIIAYHERCPVETAAAKAAELYDRVMVRFLALLTDVATNAPPDLLDYLDGLTHYVRAVPDWMTTAPRYASPRNRNQLPDPHARLAVTLRDTTTVSSAPPPIASIRWWWRP